MSFSIIGNSNHLGYGVSSPFLATGGTAPIVYSVAPEGIGGSINSNGLYTAPYSTGMDKIVAVDSLGNKTVKTVYVGTALHLLCDILQKELGLAEGRVYLYDQKIFMPTDERMFVAVSVVSLKPFGNTVYFDPINNSDIQSSNFGSAIQIDIMSRSTEALLRKEEVLMALKSTYAEQQQELNSFHVGVISTGFTNLSGLDGSAIPYRFSITVNVQYQVKKVGSVSYFDDFEDPSVITNP